MKHPHCNRSRVAHLFWCRGFAPVFFIVATALIVVAIGSGVYFWVYKDTVRAPGPQDAAALLPREDAASTTTVPDANSGASAAPVAGNSSVATMPGLFVPGGEVKDCGSNKEVTAQCMAERLATCSPAKGTVVDPRTGLTIEQTVGGYRGSACVYHMDIVSGEGSFALLAGMDVNCLLPKAVLATAVQGGSMSQDDMIDYCTGTFIDLLHAQTGASR